jgi:hypothetical protein
MRPTAQERSAASAKRLRCSRALLPALLASALLIGIPPASAAPLYSGGLSPTIYQLRADLNDDHSVDGADDSNAFYGDTSIIDGMLDCDSWSDDVNRGTEGSTTITDDDDCTLVGYDGSSDGVTIDVVDGEFATMDGVAIASGTALPFTFNETDPDDPSIINAQFGWSVIEGRVDSDRNGEIDMFDQAYGLIGSLDDAGLGDPFDGTDVLAGGCPGRRNCREMHSICRSIPCQFNGMVDLNSDAEITNADTCSRCFFGKGVESGLVTTHDGGGGEPSPTPPPAIMHERTASMAFGQQLVATGMVAVTDGTTACFTDVPVQIQRRVNGHWRTVGTTTTDLNGAYRVHPGRRDGKYRARAPRTTLASGDICANATSAPVWNGS